jgi:hypothetical protein
MRMVRVHPMCYEWGARLSPYEHEIRPLNNLAIRHLIRQIQSFRARGIIIAVHRALNR